MDNNRYTTAEEIMAAVNSKHANKATNIIHFVNWCHECEVNVLRHAPFRVDVDDYEIEIVDGLAKQPCNVYRVKNLKSAKTGENPILLDTFGDNGTFFDIPDNAYVTQKDGKQYVYLDYEAIPLHAESKLPLILKGHELACQAYCVKMLYFEDYLNDKIGEGKWRTIEYEFTEAVKSASTGTRYITNNEKKRITHTMYNIIQNVIYHRGM